MATVFHSTLCIVNNALGKQDQVRLPPLICYYLSKLSSDTSLRHPTRAPAMSQHDLVARRAVAMALPMERWSSDEVAEYSSIEA
jgi:hypothetical protein